MPMYNAGAGVEHTINALLAQTLKSMEIIIVNDGSTDESAELVHRYAAANEHIKVIDQPNGGVSRARNSGLAVAGGLYVTFPDADDVMQPDMYQTLTDMAMAEDLDVAQCNAECCFLQGQYTRHLIPYDRLQSVGVMSGPAWLNKALLTDRYLHVVWMAIYRLSLIRQLQLIFEPGLHHQDIPWTTELMMNASRVRYIDAPLYRYTVHHQSVSHRKRTGQYNVAYQRHYLKVVRMLDEINRRYASRVKIYPSFHRQVTREALVICHAIRREPDKDTQQEMIDEFFSSDTHKIMLRNARGIEQWYQLLLWLARLKRWS